MKKPEKKESRKFNINLLVDEVLAGLNERSRNIISVRYGLKGGRLKSLSEIGRKLGVTRERVRQIEADSFKKLKNLQKSEAYQKFIEEAKKIIEASGGFCEKSFLKESLVKNPTDLERNQLIFLFNSSADLHFRKGTLFLKGFWYKEKAFKISNIIAIHNDILNLFKKEKKVLSFEEIWKYIEQSCWKSFFEMPEGKNRLEMILLISRIIKNNFLGEWGLVNWKSISERGSREKAYLILKKYKEPLHFKKITDYINLHWSKKRSLPQTVHNELIKDRRFVLVGRGVYGLEEWGMIGGTVKEIIFNLFKEKQSPLAKNEIIQYVLEKKRVKETTILVNLSNQRYFNKDEEGRYFIKK